MLEHLRVIDPAVYDAVKAEAGRQASQLELIASENFVSPAVLEAMGTVLTNKYAEGLPNKRYYGGCEHVDVVEELARERAKTLFNADHANVQPHAGAQANLAAFMAFLKAGDRILGMSLSHGGHLTHGSPVNFSGTLFEVGAYGVRDSDGRIDYDALRDQAVAASGAPAELRLAEGSYAVLTLHRPRNVDDAATYYAYDAAGRMEHADGSVIGVGSTYYTFDEA